MTDTSDKALLALADKIKMIHEWKLGKEASDTLRAIVAERQATPADRLAEALRLPEVRALIEAATAARIVLAEHEPHPLPVLGKLLTALRPFTGEARHE